MAECNGSVIEETISTVAHTLLNRVRGNDQHAWDLLVELHAPLVYAWCRRRGLRPDEACEVGQSVFAELSHGFSRAVGNEQHHFRQWIYYVTQAKISDYRGSLGTGSESSGQPVPEIVVGPPPEPDRDATTGADDKTLFVQILRSARDRIDPAHWDVFWKVAVDERTPADVGAEMGLDRHVVYRIKAQVLHLLRGLYVDCDHKESK